MKIAKIIIENFRSIKGPLEINLNQINALVGPNNVGKSNILLALKKIFATKWLSVGAFDEKDVYQGNPEKDIIISVELEDPIEYKEIKSDPSSVAIKTLIFKYTHYKIGPSAGEPRLEKSCLDEGGKTPVVLSKKPQTGEKHQYKPIISIPQEVLEQIPVIFIDANRQLKDQLPKSKYSLLRQLLKDVNEDFNSPQNTIEIERQNGSKKVIARKDFLNKLMERAITLLKTEEFSTIEESIKTNILHQLGLNPKEENDIDFYFAPPTSSDLYESLDLYIKENGFSSNATELGGGFQNVIVMAILKTFEEKKKKGAIFLIEEPELYLHPQMQRFLYKTLRNIGKDNQIIYTTHSPHFVTIPEYNEVVLIAKDKNGTNKKTSNLSKNDISEEKMQKEFDPERNELFFAKKLILAEGDTEKFCIPEFAKKMGVDFDNIGATLVEVGGKRNLLDFAKIAISFEIPTCIIYDEDSSDFRNDEKGEEQKYNQSLDLLGTDDERVIVKKFKKKYEDELKKEIGEKEYQKLCQKYPNRTNAVRQKLIASDFEVKVPKFIEPIIQWLQS